MPTTFDRYLLRRYLHVFIILMISMYGLYVVIDGFTNIDEFQEVSDDAWVVARTMGRRACRRCGWFGRFSTVRSS